MSKKPVVPWTLNWSDRAAPDPDSEIRATAPVSFEIEIRPSARRRKTASAFWQGDRIAVQVPAHLSKHAQADTAQQLARRLVAKRPTASRSDTHLAERAGILADRYLEGRRPHSIRWVSNQHHRWGSCTASTGEIRVSDRLRAVPEWVLDSVLVHELAHLEILDHSSQFWTLVNRFPRHKEAEVFLAGYSLGLNWGQPQ